MAALDPFAFLRDGAVAWAADHRARVRLVGPDTRAFLHRMSTNHVAELRAGEGRLNCLTNDKGRLVDLVHHLDRGDAGVLLVGSAGRGAELCAWLDRYIFSEKIELTDDSAVGSCAELAGPLAPGIADAVVPGAAALGPWGFVEREGRLVVRGFDRVDGSGARVPAFVVLDLVRPGVVDVLVAGGAARIGEGEAEALRVAAGIPGHRGELTDAHNPLDLALHDAVHWAKGCYIGQEVIARLDTYGKQQRALVGVVFEDGAAPLLPPGEAVLVDGKPAGEITSASTQEASGGPTALAMVKLADAAGTRVHVGGRAATLVRRAAEQPPQH